MSEVRLALVAGWIVCGVISSGWFYAFVQRQFKLIAPDDRRIDAGVSILISLFGPVSLGIVYLVTGFAQHGWLWPGSVPPERSR